MVFPVKVDFSLFREFLSLIDSKQVSDDVLDFLENKILSIPQKDLLKKTQDKLKQLKIDDPRYPIDGVCEAISKMHTIVSQSKNEKLNDLLFKGMVMVAYHQPPKWDFSDVVLQFYNCFKLMQDQFHSLEISDEEFLQLLQFPNDPPIRHKFSLPLVLKEKELKLLFKTLVLEKYLTEGTSFFVCSNEHATSAHYRKKKFHYLDSNYKYAVQKAGEIEELIEYIKIAFSRESEVRNNNELYIPIHLSFFVASDNPIHKSNISLLLDKISHNKWDLVRHCVEKTGITAIWLAAQEGDVKAIELFHFLKVDPNIAEIATGITPFMAAIANRRYQAAQALTMFSKNKYKDTEIELNVLAKNKKGETALSIAVDINEMGYVSLVLKNGGKAVINEPDSHGHTPLYKACLNNNLKVVRLLLRNGANPNFRTSQIKSILFNTLVENIKSEIIKELISAGADINYVDEESGDSIFLEAVRQGYHQIVRELLFSNLTPAYFFNVQHQETAIDIALEYQDIEMLEILNPFLAACCRNDLDVIVNEYLHKGFNPNSLIDNDKCILSTCIKNKVSIDIIHALICYGADINYIDPITYDSVFIEAVKAGRGDVVSLLIKHPSFNESTAINLKAGQTALQIAFENNDTQMQAILSPFIRACQTSNLGAVNYSCSYDFSANSIIYNQKTILFFALEQGYSIGVMTVLVNNGADIHFVDPNSGNSIFLEAIKRKRLDVIFDLFLLQNNLEFDDFFNTKQNRTAIEVACETNDAQTIETILSVALNFGLVVLESDLQACRTCLLNAIKNKNYELVHMFAQTLPEVFKMKDAQTKGSLVHAAAAVSDPRFLQLIFEVEPQQNVDELNPNFKSALYIAAKRGHVENIQFLLEQGANIEIGRVICNAQTQSIELFETPLVAAVLNNKVLAVQKLLEWRANPNVAYNQNPVFHTAVMENMTEVVECFIRFGIDVNVLHIQDDDSGSISLLSLAVKHGHKAMVEMLLQNGSEVNSLLEYKESGFTSLYYAITSADFEICKLLLKNKPNLNFMFGDNESPLTFAIKENNAFIVALLLQNGAHPNISLELQLQLEESDSKEMLWLLHFYQQTTIENKIRSILIPYMPEKTNKTVGMYKDAHQTIMKQLLSIISKYDNDEERYKEIVTELRKLKDSLMLATNIKRQIKWFLDDVTPHLIEPRLLPNQNVLLRKEELIYMTKLSCS